MIVTAHQLSIGYAGKPLATQLSFTARPGEVVFIAGANGSGKTTLLLSLAGLLPVQKGTFTDLAGQIVYLPAEANGNFLELSAFQCVTAWLRLEQNVLPKERIEAELERWGLRSSFMQHVLPVEKLSTGYKRRVSLCRLSLTTRPIWLLDEPLYGLDKNGMDLFMELLTAHRQRGGTIFLVSHDDRKITSLITQTIDLQEKHP